jgi:hypothetical protein
MAGKYDAVAERTLKVIAKKGGDVVFPGAIPGVPGVYNPLSDTWTGGTGATDATGKAVQIPDDPERFAAIGLVTQNPVTLLVAAKNLGITPTPGRAFTWASRTYTIKDVEAVDPAGDGAVMYTVIGGA